MNEWQYNEDGTQRMRIREDGSRDVQSVPVGETLAQQQFKDDCDVNVILKRLLKTGEIPKWNSKTGVYADLTELPTSYKEAMDVILHADDAFMELPADVRLRFDNDPQKLMDFLADPNMVEESVKLGLRVVTSSAPVESGAVPAPSTEQKKPGA